VEGQFKITLKCRDCHLELPREYFYKRRRDSAYVVNLCKDCSKLRTRKYYRENKDTVLALAKTRQPEYRKNYALRTKYKISLEEYNNLCLQQGGKCAICNKPPTGKTILHVDHNHQTRKVRELLCNNCNTALGSLAEDITVMQAMIEYVKKWQ
jgi:hypothetical protein